MEDLLKIELDFVYNYSILHSNILNHMNLVSRYLLSPDSETCLTKTHKKHTQNFLKNWIVEKLDL